MKKIMYNDTYGLTDAVLEGRKTVTRRIAVNVNKPPYKVGEIVAIAQSYKTIGWTDKFSSNIKQAGWNNKMFVKAVFMPYKIEMLDVRLEKLQDITDEDCIKEGITKLGYLTPSSKIYGCYRHEHENYSTVYYDLGDTPSEAFAYLIDKVGRKGTWDSNPYVWRIEFKLIQPNKTIQTQ